MDKLAYLREFDPARASPREVAVARRALYEEIVLNGNNFVLTFNQLADSRAFLGLAMEREEMLAAIKGPMLCGAIKISRFGASARPLGGPCRSVCMRCARTQP